MTTLTLNRSVSAVATTNLKILVMDDQRVIADSLVQILNLRGYEAAPVYNPAQAIEHIGSNPCDLLITDVIVDGQMSGIELAIEFSKLLPLCKVLLMSGSTATAAASL